MKKNRKFMNDGNKNRNIVDDFTDSELLTLSPEGEKFIID